MVKYFVFKSNIGDLLVGVDDIFLVSIDFTTQEKVKSSNLIYGRNEKIRKQLEDYFSGKLKNFNFPIKLSGTKFQNQVWKELLKIPYGKTRTYAEIAKRIKKPRAVRAVGSAIGRNPIGIIVPCHRVIRTGGDLGGYAWGTGVKKALLELEKTNQR